VVNPSLRLGVSAVRFLLPLRRRDPPDLADRPVRIGRDHDNLLVATKGGLERPSPGQWVSNGRPDYLRGCVQASLRRLGVARIDLWQLHSVDPKVPRDEQFGVIREMRAAGLIRHVGLSNVSVADIAAAQRVFPVATVQNRYNLVDRGSQSVLDHCANAGIGFIPWYPLAAGNLAKPGSALADLAAKHQATPSQLALAWLLNQGPQHLPTHAARGRNRLAARYARHDHHQERIAPLDERRHRTRSHPRAVMAHDPIIGVRYRII
jgi:aryl-alcohol dehydrogenase-like predicted oxidoreductase